MTWLAAIVLAVVSNVVSTLITDTIHQRREKKRHAR